MTGHPHTEAEDRQDASVLRALARMWSVLMQLDQASLRFRLAVATIIVIAGKVVAVYAPFILADAINLFTEGEIADALRPFLLAVGLWTLARVFSSAAPQARDALFARVSEAAQRKLAVTAFRHIHALSVSFHQSKRTGALQRTLERGVRALDYLMRFVIFNIVPTLFELVLASIALTMAYGVGFALIAIATVVIYAFSTFAVTDWRVQQRRRMNDADTEANGRAVDSLLNYETVKAFAAEDMETARYDRAVERYASAAASTWESLALLNTVQAVIMALGLGAMAALAGYEVVQGDMGVGDITAAILILTNLYQPLNILGWAYREIRQASVDMEKLFTVFDQPIDVADAPDATPLSPKGGEVVFDAVSFRFNERVAGLTNVSFTAPAGGKLALVGPSGSGKSTLMRLLYRFYDPAEGRILIDGQDIRDVTQVSLRSALGLVPQDVVLFNDTIRANIAYGRPDADLEAIRAAARKAQLLDFIEALPQGWDTKVGERGLKLSGGERQRVGIARAILRDPPILVLDEATSALDSRTEAEVQGALAEAARGRTTLVVAHRLSTIADADRILVLRDGEVVETGTHAELTARGGLYAEMWARQAQTADAVEGNISDPMASARDHSAAVT